MPYRPVAKICDSCRRLHTGTGGLCRACKVDKERLSPQDRGYGAEWAKVRTEVLIAYGIPREQWPAYDVDHSPAYNKQLQPDHRKYVLIPRLRADHSHKTATVDVKRDYKGRFDGKKQ